MAMLTPSPKMQFVDSNGNPLSGGKLYTYETGTTTPLPTYTDSTGLVQNTNPVILDSRGEASVWLGSSRYSMTLRNSADALVWTADGIGGYVSLSELAASGGALMVGYTQAGTGAVATTVQAKLREFISVKDFGAKGDGVTDDAAAFIAAITYARANQTRIKVPWTSAGYLLSSVTLPDNDVWLEGELYNNQAPKLQAISTTGDMFSLASPVAAIHSIILKNLWFKAAASTTTARGVYINSTVGNQSFLCDTYGCRFEGFYIGYWNPYNFWSSHEKMSIKDNIKVGFYGGYGPNNVYRDCEVNTVPANAVGMWILGRAAVVINASSASNFSGANAVLWRVGTDTTQAAPFNVNLQGYAYFLGGHFETGATASNAVFIDVLSGSRASGKYCDFLVLGTGPAVNILAAIQYSFMVSSCSWEECTFGSASGGAYTNHIKVINFDPAIASLTVKPDQKNFVVSVAGFTTVQGLKIDSASTCLLTHSAVQTVNAGATTGIAFNTKVCDLNTEWSTVSNTFTALNPGIYKIRIVVVLGGTNPTVAGQRYRLICNVGGVLAIFGDFNAVNANNMSCAIEKEIVLAAGNAVTFQLQNTSAAAVDIATNPAGTYLEIRKMG